MPESKDAMQDDGTDEWVAQRALRPGHLPDQEAST